jgi:hypothetical protein
VGHERRVRHPEGELERGRGSASGAVQDADARVLFGTPAEVRGARVGRAVVDGDHLESHTALREHVVERAPEIPSRIAHGKEDAHLGRVAQGFRAFT